MKLGEWIKQYRAERKLSMQDFADMCGFSKAYIGQLEKGINPSTGKPISPTIQTFNKIAVAVGMDLDKFLNMLDTDQKVTVNNFTPTLNERDERDIQVRLQNILDDMTNDDTVTLYNGGEPMDPETRELMKASLDNALRISKLTAKKKFTPKKYKDKK